MIEDLDNFSTMAIVDMTDGFINKQDFSNHYPSWTKDLLEKMLENICKRASWILWNGWKVILTQDERFNWDETLPVIREALNNKWGQILKCMKWWEGIFDSNTSAESLSKSRDIFSKVKNRKILVAWVQTSACVLFTCRDLEGFGLETSVWAGCTLNFLPFDLCSRSWNNIHYFNQIDYIYSAYQSVGEWLSDSLTRWWILRDEWNLFDYLWW